MSGLAKSVRVGVHRVRSWPLDVLDGALALVVGGLAFAPGTSGSGVTLGHLPTRPLDAFGVLLVLGQCLPLAVRRRWPGACLVVVASAFATRQLLGYPPVFADLALFAALYGAGAYLERARRASAVVATVGYLGLAVALHGRGSPREAFDFLTFYCVLAGSCWVGVQVHRRALAEEDRRHRVMREATAQERARIARDLHDVVTHHVTAMVVQAEATQYIPADERARAVEGLAVIASTGRRALAELRELLGVLAEPRAPGASFGPGQPDREPPLRRVSDLVERTRSAGQPVKLIQAGERQRIPSGVHFAVYRVVQESLTNALKHAPGQPTVVQIRYGDAIEVEVTTDGPVVAEAADLDGRGLIGLRERVGLFGGDLRATGRPGGGFVVRARIPAGGGQ